MAFGQRDGRAGEREDNTVSWIIRLRHVLVAIRLQGRCRWAGNRGLLVLSLLLALSGPRPARADETRVPPPSSRGIVLEQAPSDASRSRPVLTLPSCDYVPLHLVAKLGEGPAKENSGMVKSRRHHDVYWLHNDSGDKPRVYAINSQGRTYRTDNAAEPGVLLTDAVNVDWEDIAVDDRGHLIVADVGNNHNDRQDLTLYVLPEPDPLAEQADVERKIVIRYPDQAEFPAGEDHFNFDCEAIFTIEDDIYLLSKHRSDEWTSLYRLDPDADEVGLLTYVDRFNTHGGVVAADCSPNGLELIVATYQSLWLFERADKTESFFDGDVSWGRLLSKQIEAVTFQDSQTLLLADEQLGALYRVDLRDLIPVQAAGKPMIRPNPTCTFPSAAQLAELTPGAWTLVVIPDTQYYVDHTRKVPPTPEVWESMMRWIVEQKTRRNIQLVVHVGDIVDNNDPKEWGMAKQVWQHLDGQIPYILATGNHDYQGNAEIRETLFSRYFTPQDNPLNDPECGGILRETFESGHLENAAYEYLAPDGRQWLYLSLEWGARDAVVDWANKVVGQRKYRKHTAVLLTHGYLYHDDTRYQWSEKREMQEGNPLSYGTATGDDNNDGEMLWQKLVRKNSPFQLVLCGHVTGTKEELMALGDRVETGYRLSVGVLGNRVHQILFNAQRQGDAGEGWLRLMEFDPDQRTVQVKTFSPWLEARGLSAWRTDADDYFVFTLTHF